MKKLKEIFVNVLKKVLINSIDSNLRNLHGYVVKEQKIKKALPKTFNEVILCSYPIYAYKNEIEIAYFIKDNMQPNVPMVNLKSVKKKFNTSKFNVILNYDDIIVSYIEDFSIRELLKLYTFLFKNRIKQLFNENLSTWALVVAMITSLISIFLGIKNLNTPQEITVKVQNEQSIPQNQSEPITPENSTVTIPMIRL